MLEFIGVTEAKASLSKLLNRSQRFVLLANNAPKAVLVPFQDYKVLSRLESLVRDPEALSAVLAASTHRVLPSDRELGLLDLEASEPSVAVIRPRSRGREIGEVGELQRQEFEATIDLLRAQFLKESDRVSVQSSGESRSEAKAR